MRASNGYSLMDINRLLVYFFGLLMVSHLKSVDGNVYDTDQLRPATVFKEREIQVCIHPLSEEPKEIQLTVQLSVTSTWNKIIHLAGEASIKGLPNRDWNKLECKHEIRENLHTLEVSLNGRSIQFITSGKKWSNSYNFNEMSLFTKGALEIADCPQNMQSKMPTTEGPSAKATGDETDKPVVNASGDHTIATVLEPPKEPTGSAETSMDQPTKEELRTNSSAELTNDVETELAIHTTAEPATPAKTPVVQLREESSNDLATTERTEEPTSVQKVAAIAGKVKPVTTKPIDGTADYPLDVTTEPPIEADAGSSEGKETASPKDAISVIAEIVEFKIEKDTNTVQLKQDQEFEENVFEVSIRPQSEGPGKIQLILQLMVKSTSNQQIAKAEDYSPVYYVSIIGVRLDSRPTEITEKSPEKHIWGKVNTFLEGLKFWKQIQRATDPQSFQRINASEAVTTPTPPKEGPSSTFVSATVPKETEETSISNKTLSSEDLRICTETNANFRTLSQARCFPLFDVLLSCGIGIVIGGLITITCVLMCCTLHRRNKAANNLSGEQSPIISDVEETSPLRR